MQVSMPLLEKDWVEFRTRYESGRFSANFPASGDPIGWAQARGWPVRRIPFLWRRQFLRCMYEDEAKYKQAVQYVDVYGND